MLATLLFLAAVTAEPEITVRGSAARPAIERILKADNLDVEVLSPREVADAMRGIQQGAAPRAFWLAYRAHAKAWAAYADALAAARHRPAGEPAPVGTEFAIGQARVEINRSFDEVEALARRYGARLPLPRTRV